MPGQDAGAVGRGPDGEHLLLEKPGDDAAPGMPFAYYMATQALGSGLDIQRVSDHQRVGVPAPFENVLYDIMRKIKL